MNILNSCSKYLVHYSVIFSVLSLYDIDCTKLTQSFVYKLELESIADRFLMFTS